MLSFQAVNSGELRAFDWGSETKNLEKGNQVRKSTHRFEVNEGDVVVTGFCRGGNKIRVRA